VAAITPRCDREVGNGPSRSTGGARGEWGSGPDAEHPWLVALVSSAGGLRATSTVLAGLASDFSAAIVVARS
jgi:hypothetical protein